MADDGVTAKRLRPRGARRTASAQLAAKGATVDRILDSAEQVLRGHGYAGFTTRRVAEAAGIAPGNLSYHYPTKVELLRALIARLIANYSGQIQDALRQPDRGLDDILHWLLGAASTKEANSLFRELWAMALHDEVVRKAVDAFYDQVMRDVEDSLLVSYPQADPQHIRDLVQLFAVISEGGGVIYGLREVPSSAHARLIDLALKFARMIAPELSAGPPLSSTGSSRPRQA